jgi:hypothetical protein
MPVPAYCGSKVKTNTMELLLTLPERVGHERYYSQRDQRWARRLYTVMGDPEQTIESSGCMPCRQAAIVTTLTDLEVTPHAMAQFNIEMGFRTPDRGTLHRALFALDAFGGIQTFEIGPEDMGAVLELGGMVTVSGRHTPDTPTSLPGSLTGHIYGIRQEDGNRMWVNDPDDVTASLMPHSRDELLPTFNRLYASFGPDIAV